MEDQSQFYGQVGRDLAIHLSTNPSERPDQLRSLARSLLKDYLGAQIEYIGPLEVSLDILCSHLGISSVGAGISPQGLLLKISQRLEVAFNAKAKLVALEFSRGFLAQYFSTESLNYDPPDSASSHIQHDHQLGKEKSTIRGIKPRHIVIAFAVFLSAGSAFFGLKSIVDFLQTSRYQDKKLQPKQSKSSLGLGNHSSSNNYGDEIIVPAPQTNNADAIQQKSPGVGWVKEGKWSTATLNCSGTLVKIGIDMNSRIGGGDASPVRNAYMVVNGLKMDSVWIVGASMDSVETNNRAFTLITGSSDGNYLQSLGVPNKRCSHFLPPANNLQVKDPDSAAVSSIQPLEIPGLKLVDATLVYNDGDSLEALFRVYCPSQQIRPTQYVLRSSSGILKKQGDWWEKSFPPKWKAEHDLIAKVCRR